jgi:hypothetical protein
VNLRRLILISPEAKRFAVLQRVMLEGRETRQDPTIRLALARVLDRLWRKLPARERALVLGSAGRRRA